jgi:hypothetical protein
MGRPWRQQPDIAATFTRLSRTFMAQVETLKRYRSVERQVTVEQVTVNDGGQAIVGQVEMNGVGNGGTSVATRADESSPPTPWTGSEPAVAPGDAEIASPEIPPPTPWTESEAMSAPSDAEASGPETSPPTPWTGNEPAAAPGDAEVASPEIPPPTPWTGSAAPPSGLPPRPRRPGAYLQVLRENLAATP